MISQTLPLKVPYRIHRIAVGTIFFLYGLCFASWASRIPSIQQHLGLSESKLGLVLFTLPVGLMVSLPLAGWLIAKAGSRKVVIVGALAYTLVLISVGWANNVIQLIFGLFVFGLAGNMLNIAVNTQAVGVEALYKRTIMASFHGLWSLAGFAGAAIGTLMIGQGISPHVHFIIVAALALIMVLISGPYTLKEDRNREPGTPVFAKPDKSLINLGIIAFCSMICEGTMFDWSGVYFKKVIGAEDAWMGAGYTAFMSTMALGRFIADRFTVRFGIRRILQASGLLTATGLFIAILFPVLTAAISGFLLVGVGVSSVVPLVYSAAGKSTVLSPGVALAAVSTIGFFGFLSGPPLVGLVAGATSLRISFSIIAAMGLAIVVVAGRLKT